MKESETTRWFPKWRAKNVLTTVRRRNHGLRRRENFFNFDPLNWLKTTLFRTDLERNEAANFPNESWELKKLFLCKKVGRGKASCPHSRWRGPCESLILSGGQSQLKMMSKKRTRLGHARISLVASNFFSSQTPLPSFTTNIKSVNLPPLTTNIIFKLRLKNKFVLEINLFPTPW